MLLLMFQLRTADRIIECGGTSALPLSSVSFPSFCVQLGHLILTWLDLGRHARSGLFTWQPALNDPACLDRIHSFFLIKITTRASEFWLVLIPKAYSIEVLKSQTQALKSNPEPTWKGLGTMDSWKYRISLWRFVARFRVSCFSTFDALNAELVRKTNYSNYS